MAQPKARPYRELSDAAQVRRLRPVAESLLAQYRFAEPIRKVRLLMHGFNTTFRVDEGPRTWALRLNVNSKRSRGEMCAETEWVSALAQEFNPQGRDFPRFAVPLRSTAGDLVSTAYAEPLGTEIAGVVYGWLPGSVVEKKPTAQKGEAMGRALRLMQEHAQRFTLPAGASLRSYDTVLFGKPYLLDELAPGLEHANLKEVFARGNELQTRLNQTLQMPIHYDLHDSNVKFHNGRLSVFDFDDSILGHPILDVAVAVFYLRRHPPEMEEAFWKGLGYRPEDHGVSVAEFENLVACRALGLAQDCFFVDTAEWQSWTPRYAAVVAARIEHFLGSGRFDPTVVKFEE